MALSQSTTVTTLNLRVRAIRAFSVQRWESPWPVPGVVVLLAMLAPLSSNAQGIAPHQQWTDGYLDPVYVEGKSTGRVNDLPPVYVEGRSTGGMKDPPFYPSNLPSLGGGKSSGGSSGGGGGGAGTVGNRDPGKDQRKDPPPTDNSKPDDCATSAASNPTTKNPVIIATGEKIKEETDFLSFGQYGLSHSRMYRRNYPGSAMFGAYWWSSLSYPKLVTSGCFSSPDYGCEPTTVQMWKLDGSRDVYQHIAGTDGPALYSAAGSASGGTFTYYPNLRWVLTRDRMTYTYSPTGYLKNISGPMGLSIGFTYSTTAPSQLVKVTNNVGKSVTFSWSAGHVTSLTDPAGGVWQYTYNALGLLETVTSPGASPDVRRYHYESSTSSSLLTGISINSVRYSTYAYDPATYKVTESGLAGGEERETFVYGTNTTTVTSATGQVTTYNFASNNGALRLTSTSRAATTSCPAAAASIAYDANGYIDYKLDWNGNKTDYNFDSTGRLLDLVTAAGTTSQLTTTNMWNGIDLQEKAFKDSAGTAYAKVAYTYVTTGPATGRLASETWADFKVATQRQTLYGYAFYANNSISAQTVTRVLSTGNATTTTAYDTLGNVQSVTNALGHRTTWELQRLWAARPGDRCKRCGDGLHL
jgi:YD repeat-containing protein